MAARALIVAIEHYPQSKSTSQTLPGTIAHAERFAKLSESDLEVKREHILFCCSGNSSYRTHGATRTEIKAALIQLVKDGLNRTDRLLLFMSGHGVMKSGQGAEPHKDVLLCSDFISSDISGDACLQVDELTTFLSRSLGAGTHFWFIDACRTQDAKLIPSGLSLNADQASSGTASWYQMLSTPSGGYAATDELFIESLTKFLNGDCELERDSQEEGCHWVTFRNLAKGMEDAFAAQQRGIELKCTAEKSNDRIRRIYKPGPAATILDAKGRKSPPVELLTAYDEVIFLGETNGQLPALLSRAFAERQNRRWKRLVVLCIEDLSQAGRRDATISELDQERKTAEEFLKDNAAKITDALAVYRYDYVGTYGSFWTASDGRRRAHVSPRVLGIDIRSAPSTDLVDFPHNKHPTVELYFQLADDAIRRSGTRCVFRHPEKQE